ncbi:MAG: pseudouridine synthase [Gammaproteobacteria bacterium]|jgi:tRNA pseudouridine65 synthase|nr:pseudouridine synthase [Gammaproteobacteria bacterium]
MLNIIFQDDELVAINKPSGLLVHRSPIDKRETRFAVQELRNQLGQHVYPLHRLDKPTSGVLVFALSSAAASFYGQQWQDNRVAKRYLALTRGFVPQEMTVNYALRQEADKAAGIVAGEEGQAAITEIRCLASYCLPSALDRYEQTRFSLVECRPLTGRKHQIRRHLKHISHPIIGDSRHGKGPLNRACAEYFGIGRLWLHCQSIELQHRDGARLQLQAELAQEFNTVLARLAAFEV